VVKATGFPGERIDAEHIVTLLDRNGSSITTMERELGLSKGYIRQSLKRSRMNLDVLDRMAIRLGVSLDEVAL